MPALEWPTLGKAVACLTLANIPDTLPERTYGGAQSVSFGAGLSCFCMLNQAFEQPPQCWWTAKRRFQSNLLQGRPSEERT